MNELQALALLTRGKGTVSRSHLWVVNQQLNSSSQQPLLKCLFTTCMEQEYYALMKL